MRAAIRVSAFFAVFVALCSSALADLRVPLDQAAAISLRAPARGVIVGNPSIAGVSVQNDRLIFVTGRSYGATNLIVVGDDGRPLYQTRVVVTADEANAVILNRGASSVRFDCAPECRRRPDISDDPGLFKSTQDQINTRGEVAKGGN